MKKLLLTDISNDTVLSFPVLHVPDKEFAISFFFSFMCGQIAISFLARAQNVKYMILLHFDFT